jgi:hypothetical protein
MPGYDPVAHASFDFERIVKKEELRQLTAQYH